MRVQLLSRLYPPQWRERYGAEFGDLIEELPFSFSLLVDVCRNALQAQIAERGHIARTTWVPGGPMLSTLRCQRITIAAALLLLPSVALLAAFTLKHKLGVPGPFDALWWGSAQRFHPFNYLLVFAPTLSLLLAVRPIVSLSLRRRGGSVALELTGRAVPLNIALALAAVLLGAVLLRYFVAPGLMPPVLIPTPWIPSHR